MPYMFATDSHLWLLFMTTCVSRHPLSRTGGFC